MFRNKTENEFQSMTASQGNQSFFFSNVIIAFYRVFWSNLTQFYYFTHFTMLKDFRKFQTCLVMISYALLLAHPVLGSQLHHFIWFVALRNYYFADCIISYEIVIKSELVWIVLYNLANQFEHVFHNIMKSL